MTVLGVGFTALLLIFGLKSYADGTDVLSESAWLPSDVPLESSEFVLGFVFIFIAFVIGEFFIITGQTYLRKQPEQLRLHRISQFALTNDYWMSRFEIANRRNELFCGLKAIGLTLGSSIILVHAMRMSLDVLGIFSGLLAIFFGFFFRSLAAESYDELEKAIASIQENEGNS